MKLKIKMYFFGPVYFYASLSCDDPAAGIVSYIIWYKSSELINNLLTLQ